MLLLVAVVVLTPFPSLSFQPFDSPPPLIRITGVLLSPGEETRSQYQTLEVMVAGEPRILRVREVESLTNAVQGWSILRNLGSFLILTGPPALLERLDNEETRGQPLRIEGRLYLRDRVLMLTAVESALTRFK
jgi:hypothetical protein